MSFRRALNTVSTPRTTEKGGGATTPSTANGEVISDREAQNMQLSLWEQMKGNLKQAVKLYLNWIDGLIGCCGGIIFFGIYQLWFIPYLMVKYEYSRTLSSIVVGLGLAGSAVGVLGFGEISRRYGPRKPVIFGGIAMYSTIIALIYIPNLPLGIVIVLSVIIGAAFGCVMLVFVLSREYNWYYGAAETATGLVNMVVLSSGFIGQYTIGALLDFHYQRRTDENGGESESREYTADDYQFAFSVAPIAVLLMFLLTFALKETNGKNLDYGDGEETEPKLTSIEMEATNIERSCVDVGFWYMR